MNENNNPLSFGTDDGRLTYASYFDFAYDAFDRLYQQFPSGFVFLKLYLTQQSGFTPQLVRTILNRFSEEGLDALTPGHLKYFYIIDWAEVKHSEATILMISKLCHAAAYTDIQLTTIRDAYRVWRREKLLNYLNTVKQ